MTEKPKSVFSSIVEAGKLGIRDGLQIFFIDGPASVVDTLARQPAAAIAQKRALSKR